MKIYWLKKKKRKFKKKNKKKKISLMCLYEWYDDLIVQ